VLSKAQVIVAPPPYKSLRQDGVARRAVDLRDVPFFDVSQLLELGNDIRHASLVRVRRGPADDAVRDPEPLPAFAVLLHAAIAKFARRKPLQCRVQLIIVAKFVNAQHQFGGCSARSQVSRVNIRVHCWNHVVQAWRCICVGGRCCNERKSRHYNLFVIVFII
jgi:hypothetical protein